MLLLQHTWQRNIQCFLRVQVRVFHSFSLMSVECRPSPLIHPSLPCIGDRESERKRERDRGTERDREREEKEKKKEEVMSGCLDRAGVNKNGTVFQLFASNL